MTRTEQGPGSGERKRSGGPDPARSLLSLVLSAEHPFGPTGWPLDRPAFRDAALWSFLLDAGWRTLDELEDDQADDDPAAA